MKRACWLVFGLLLAGCGYQDFERPALRNYASDAIYTSPRPPETMQVDVVRLEQLAQASKRWREATGEEIEYTLGAGDTLKLTVRVPGRAEPSIAADLVIDKQGVASCPMLGDVRLAGLRAAEAAAKLTGLYKDGYFLNPGLTLAIGDYGSKRVCVAGAVVKPGVVFLKENRSTVLEALLLAGGLSPDAGNDAIVTRAPLEDARSLPTTLVVSLHELIDNADVTQNIVILPGDIVNVPLYKPSYFCVLGYVVNPGVYEMPRRNPSLGLVGAVAMAHGLTASARADKTVLIRQTPEGKKRFYVNLVGIASADSQDIRVQPDDLIIVGTSATRRFLDSILSLVGLRTLAPAY